MQPLVIAGSHHIPFPHTAGERVPSPRYDFGQDGTFQARVSRQRRIFHLFVMVTFAFVVTLDAAEEKIWYKNISPYSDKNSILQKSGDPVQIDGETYYFKLPQGSLKIVFNNGVISDCTQLDPGGVAISGNHYATYNRNESEENEININKYITGKYFSIIPKINGEVVRTSKYINSTCYKKEDGYVVVEPIISLMGSTGFFSDKTAIIINVDKDLKEDILYKAFDSWDKLVPPGIDDAELKRRKEILENKEKYDDVKQLISALGTPDSRMGSGVDYSLYYFTKGLLLISEYTTMENIKLIKPGYE
jgi:hypothetical protein